VQREPDDQQPGQGQLAAVGGLADGQAFGEVVQADPGGDAHAGAQRRRLDRRRLGKAASAMNSRPGPG
jgi:hypothetical protein